MKLNKPFSLLFVLAFTSFLMSCSQTENKKETEHAAVETTEKNGIGSAAKTDSLAPGHNKEAEKAEATTNEALPDSTEFHKVLSFKNITFDVKAVGKGSLQKTTIQPSGLTATNRAETLETEPVTGAEIADLNADGYPELLIFTQSAGSGSYGKVIAFSVNKGKSMSAVTFPETSQNPEIKNGYGGHDKFTITDNALTQEFPIYNEGDTNNKPSGKKRQITYKLKDGEASRVFVVDQVKEVSVK